MMSRGHVAATAAAVGLVLASAAPTAAQIGGAALSPTEGHMAPEPPFGLAYEDPQTHVLLYVETDRRHVTAFDASGRILWAADPFADAKLEPYRTENPQIFKIGPPGEWNDEYPLGPYMRPGRRYVGIEYNSTQFGLVDEADGKFQFLGQN
jgi:hypothetical protein